MYVAAVAFYTTWFAHFKIEALHASCDLTFFCKMNALLFFPRNSCFASVYTKAILIKKLISIGYQSNHLCSYSINVSICALSYIHQNLHIHELKGLWMLLYKHKHA